jgi:CRISPR/Cas system-associated exonuclease Cas4 (RecB family)
MKVIRASEVGSYLFCKRAWWYQQHGYSSDNQIELAGGSEMHEKHGRLVTTSKRLKFVGYISLFLAILTLIIWIGQFFF